MTHANDNAPLTAEQEFDRANGLDRHNNDWEGLASRARKRAMQKRGHMRKIWLEAAEAAERRARFERLLAS